MIFSLKEEATSKSKDFYAKIHGKSIKFYKKLYKYIIDNIVSLKKNKRSIDLKTN